MSLFDFDPLDGPAETAEINQSAGATSYDRVAYVTEPTARTSPAHLAAIAALFGVSPPVPNGARVLEVGCGSGNNLINIAAALPESFVVGIDLSQAAIAEAKVSAAELGLSNIRFEQRDLEEFGSAEEPFDFIIAHGLYSWVPAKTQSALLGLINRLLSPNGVAMVSFNTLPGWYLRGIFRELALFHLRDTNDPAERVKKARHILEGLHKFGRSEDGFSNEQMRSELGQILKMPDWYLFHDLLEQNNQPCYFAEFIEQLSLNGLQYVGDAEPQKNDALEFPEEGRNFLASLSDERNGFEQYTDFFRMRMFRRAVICKGSVQLSMPDRRRVERGDLYVASQMRYQPGGSPTEPMKFLAPNGGGLTIGHRWMQQIIAKLIDRWPLSISTTELLSPLAADTEKLGQAARTLLDGFFAGVLEFTTAPSIVSQIGERPNVFAPARLGSRRGMTRVGNVRHELVYLPAAVAALLPVIDGTRELASFEADFSAFSPLLSPEDAKQFPTYMQIFEFLEKSSLLV